MSCSKAASHLRAPPSRLPPPFLSLELTGEKRADGGEGKEGGGARGRVTAGEGGERRGE